MEHAFVLCSQNIITFDHLPPDFMSAAGIEHRSPDKTQAVDFHAILEALGKTAWNKAKAARLLGIDRVTLYWKIKRYNLTEDTPNVEVLHVTWKKRNASVACNAFSIHVHLLERSSLLP